MGYARFYDLLRFEADEWPIVRRVALFEKDMIQTVGPGADLRLDPTVLTTFPLSYRYFAYALSLRRTEINRNLSEPGTAEMRPLYDQETVWLRQA